MKPVRVGRPTHLSQNGPTSWPDNVGEPFTPYTSFAKFEADFAQRREAGHVLEGSFDIRTASDGTDMVVWRSQDAHRQWFRDRTNPYPNWYRADLNTKNMNPALENEMAALGYDLWGHKYGHLDETRMADFEEHCKAEVAARDAAQVAEIAERARQHEDWLAAGGRYNGG